METWSFQVRIHLADSVAGLARQDPTNPILESLTTGLSRHNVSMKSHNWLRVFRGGRICLAAAPGLDLARPW
jgi:hypothetical protein